MADGSKIEWTDASWNPIRARVGNRIGWHCEILSAGCEHCYAEAINHRLGTGDDYLKKVRRAEIFIDDKMLAQPLHWRRPRRIFVCSMSDLFGEWVPDEMIDRVFAVMALAPQHVFQVLTKRAARMHHYMADVEREAHLMDAVAETIAAQAISGPVEILGRREPWVPLPHVWLGVSVEDQRRADERIPDLLATPAAMRWMSAEPLIGPIDLTRCGTIEKIRTALPGIVEQEERGRPASGAGSICGAQIDAIGSRASSITFFQTPDHMGGFTAASPRQWPCLDWVVCGGESGRGARPMEPDWPRALRDQCADAGVPYFFKQHGEWIGEPDLRRLPGGQGPGFGVFDHCEHNIGHSAVRVGKRAAGRLLDGREWNEYPATDIRVRSPACRGWEREDD